MLRGLFLGCCLVSVSVVQAQQVLSQKAELQPAQLSGTAGQPVQQPAAVIADADFSGGPRAAWIWGPNNDAKYVLRTTVKLDAVPSAARLKASCDNVCAVFVNGKRVGGGSEWQEPSDASVAGQLQPGLNVIEAEVENQGGAAGFVLKLAMRGGDGKLTWAVSDEAWTFADRRGADGGDPVQVRGRYGDGPWNDVFSREAIVSRVPAGVFELLPGFAVEKLFTVPKDELGSWVCIAFDGKGRLLASDQGDKGICRITLPAAGERGGETRVERLDFSKCEVQPTGAQGMLWAFDSLYFSINGGPGSGLYRARDTDGDDQFDQCVKLKDFRGGGEHGPHALRLSPDGQRIFVICGNHTKPPFDEGEELTNRDYTSRIPTNWSEDHLLPRMWDANGHARGIMAPGGWIASTDVDGKTWDICSHRAIATNPMQAQMWKEFAERYPQFADMDFPVPPGVDPRCREADMRLLEAMNRDYAAAHPGDDAFAARLRAGDKIEHSRLQPGDAAVDDVDRTAVDAAAAASTVDFAIDLGLGEGLALRHIQQRQQFLKTLA